MRVREVMTPVVDVIPADSSLQEAAAKMQALEIGFLPVCEGDRVVGMVTDRDITIRATAKAMDPIGVPVRDIMTPEVISCFEDELVGNAARLMGDHQIRRLVVLDRDKRPVGVVTLGDLAVETGDEQLAGNTLEAVS